MHLCTSWRPSTWGFLSVMTGRLFKTSIPMNTLGFNILTLWGIMSSAIFIGQVSNQLIHLMKFHPLALLNIKVIFQCYRALGVKLTFTQLGPALLPCLSLGPRNILPFSTVWQAGKLVNWRTYRFIILSHQGLSLALSCWAWSPPRSEDLWRWNTPTLSSNLSHRDLADLPGQG